MRWRDYVFVRPTIQVAYKPSNVIDVQLNVGELTDTVAADKMKSVVKSPFRGEQMTAHETPYHVQISVCDGDIFWQIYYYSEQGFEFKIECGDFTFVDGRTWPSIEGAATAAAAVLRDLPNHPEIVRNRPMLHLYLRRPRATRAYKNVWQGDFRLLSITTYESVAQCCTAALERGHRIRVHRRKFERIPATICSECAVKSVEPIDGGNGFKVEFEDWTTLTIEREKYLQQGWYFDCPSSYEKALKADS